MREIKFRAWDEETESYIEIGFDFRVDGNGSIYRRAWGETVWDRTTNLILEQFTGLKDKNGTEMYEGDIVEYFQFSQICSKCAHREKVVNEVRFNSLGATLSSYRIIDPMSDISELEVIGNVHENIKLLGEVICG